MATIDFSNDVPENGVQTNNTIVGTSEDDVIVAGPDEQQTVLVEHTHTEVIGGGKGGATKIEVTTYTEHDVIDNDTIEGGLGNDTMSGGYGNDTFVFNFTVDSILKTANFSEVRDAPSTNADYKAWQNYTNQLEAWRTEMATLHGTDAVDADTFDHWITVNGGTLKKPAYSQVEFTGDASYAWYENSITGDGHDQVLDWSNGHDKLLLQGLSNDSSLSSYWGNWLTSDGVQDGQTVISFGSGSDAGSITLIGTDMSIADLVAGGHVQFG